MGSEMCIRDRSLGVHHHVLDGGIVRIGDELWPEPESLGAGVDGWSHLEAIVLVEKYSVEDITFSSSVLSYYCNNSDVFILIGL